MEIDNTGGVRIGLDEFRTENRVASHFESFLNYFGYNGTTQYNGTIFRFPLRTGRYETSLPNNAYNPDKVLETLFDPFRQEIENCLLFLKKVTSIKVSVKESSGISKLLYSAEIDPRFRPSLLGHRMEMFDFVKNGGHMSSSFIYLSIFPTRFTSDTEQTRLWLVLNMLGVGGAISPALRISFSKQSESYLPWFALALPLPHATGALASIGSDLCWSMPFVDLTTLFVRIDNLEIPIIPLSNEDREFIGSLFCFLPIAARSNFPFHIHGYFALSTNRRSIKWPRFDDNSEEASWNMELVKSLGTQCYAILLYVSISKFQTEGDGGFQYSLWSHLPSKQDSQQLDGLIHRGALEIIQHQSIVFTNCNSRWIQLDHAMFLPSIFSIKMPNEQVCRDLLIALSHPVVNISSEIANVIAAYDFLDKKIRPKVVTPAMMRQILISFKDNEHLLHFLSVKQNVFSLLEIVLNDVSFPCSNISAVLNGIRLIPIYMLDLPASFGGSNKFYISERPQKFIKLFPGLENFFVEPALPPRISSLLLKLSRTGKLNLKDITDIRNNPTLFVDFLERSMRKYFDLNSPVKWTLGVNRHPEREWIELVWKFIKDSSIIEELIKRKCPILPKQSISSVQIDLLPLSRLRLPYMEVSEVADYQEVEAVLGDCGCYLCERNAFIPTFHKYVYPALPRGLFSILQFPNIRNLFLQQLSKSSNSIRLSLRMIIFSIELQETHVQWTRSFPIFISISSHWVTMDHFRQYYLPPNCVPEEFSRYPENFLSPFDNANVHLCERLGVINLSLNETIQHHLLPILCNGNLSDTPQQRNLLSLWILRISPSLIDPVMLVNPKWLLDSRTGSELATRAKLYSPTELFYPSDPLIMKLAGVSQSVAFPNEMYAKYLDVLKALGLQTSEFITYKSLEAIVSSSLRNIPGTAKYEPWLNALIKLLSIHFNRLDLSSKRQFWNIFHQARFIKPSSRCMCKSYPTCLPFYTHANSLATPGQVTLCSEKEACLIAGVAPFLVENSYTPESHQIIYRCMGFQTSVTPALICEQLKFIIKTSKGEGGVNLDQNEIHSLIKKMYKYFGKNVQCQHQFINKIDHSVFIPCYGFVGVHQMILSCSEKLSPHIFSLDRYYSITDPHISNFFKLLNIKSQIDLDNCHFILQELSGTILSPEDVNLAIALINFYYDLIQSVETPRNCLILAQDSNVYLAQDCIFNDLKWMEHSSLLSLEKVVHSKIPHSIASKFGCQPASIALAPMTEDFGLGCGQSENFVDRLRGILKGYRMEMDVFKELIQNSDDAGACEVKILFDYTSYSCQSILDPRMREVQGPALYFFNNAQFSPQDLENIVQLSKGSKLKLTNKIGRFGVGFNAVYNFTDCPSFISGDIVQIFDPLQVYVGSFRRDSGVRFRYQKDDVRRIETYHDLFEVYDGIFGCNVLKGQPYEHTLFRLPFRKNESKLSDQTFEKDGISQLQQILQQELENLILFLQSITCIEVYEKIHKNEIKLLLRVSKNECETMRFLQIHREYFNNFLTLNRPTRIVSSSDIVSICSESQSETTSHKFLISYASGIQGCFDVLTKFRQLNATLLPLCGVAIPLSFLENIPNSHACFLYTFLPLPIHSPLLVHINGYFSLSDSRKNVSDASGRKSQDFPTEWNMALISDALPNALICAFEKLHTLEPLSCTSDLKILSNYFSLWPVRESTELLWRQFSQCFAERIVSNMYSNRRLFPSAQNPLTWVDFEDCSFLSLQNSLISNKPFLNCIYSLSDLCRNTKTFVYLPNQFYSSQIFRTFARLRPDKIYDLKKLCEGFIFPMLDILTLDQLVIIFNTLIPLCNYESNTWLFDSLQKTKFIPCSGVGSSHFVLRSPSQVVFPNSIISKLYHPQDTNKPVPQLHSRFDHTKNDVFTQVLKYMGVLFYLLPDAEIVGRCKITCQLTPLPLAVQHASCLIEYLYTAVREDETLKGRIYEDIKNIPFIPTYRDSLCEICSLPLDDFAAPKDCFPFHLRHLVTPNFPSATETVKDISTIFHILPQITINNIFTVLNTLISNAKNISTSSDISEKILSLYKYLAQIHDSSDLNLIERELSHSPWVFHPKNGKFYPTNRVIISPDYLDFENVYLISFPYRDILTDKNFEDFLKKIGMKKDVDNYMIVDCLQRVHQSFDNNPIPEDLVKFVLKLVDSIRYPIGNSARVFILSQMNILHPPSELFVSFSPHLEEFLTSENSEKSVHCAIHPRRAYELGAKLSEELFSDSFEFGLEEKITDRIQNLIREMPMSSLVKELIQNAEDAQAEEILFILDDQDYSKFDSKLCLANEIFPEWKKLNSFPSLCVYNNRGFSAEDLKGIQTLSVGGKTGERESIGKFGLGFSSVYRITDAPTFITSKDGKEGLTFCCFDPYLKYTVSSSRIGSRGKRGKRVDINTKENLEKFSDQICPFKFTAFQDNPDLNLTNLWNDGDFTMFRLPLDIELNSDDTNSQSMHIPYRRQEIRKHYSLKEISQEIINCIKNCPEMLLFLKSVQQLKVISVDKCKRVSLHCSLSVERLKEGYLPVPNWHPLKIEDNFMVEVRQITISQTNTNTYLIYSLPEVPDRTEDYLRKDQTLEEHSKIYREEKLRRFGGVAVCFSPLKKNMSSKLFTFLPLDTCYFPVHINAPLILDSSRQNVHSRGEDWEDSWHSSVVKFIIAPLYAMLLLDLRYPSEAIQYTPGDEPKYFRWYYSLFPNRVTNSKILSQTSQELYNLFHQSNQRILLAHDFDISEERKWYHLHEPNCGIFKPSTFFCFPNQENRGDLDQSVYIDFNNREDQIRKYLVLIQYPLTFAPCEILPAFEPPLTRLDQCKLITYLQNNPTKLFKRNDTINLEHSILKFEEIQTILEFILRAENKDLECEIIPLRVDIKNNLRCFSRDKPSFQSHYASLLPHRNEDFVSDSYNSNILSRLRVLGFVKSLDVNYLAEYLKLDIEPSQCKLFWRFALENELNKEELMKFAENKLVPLGNSSFYPMKFLKYVLTRTLEMNDCVLFSALSKLGCHILSLQGFGDHSRESLIIPITSLFDSIAISVSRPPGTILGSLEIANPHCLSVSLEAGEACILLQILSLLQNIIESLTIEQLHLISLLKIFETHSGVYHSLSECRICFVSIDSLQIGPVVLNTLLKKYGLIVFKSNTTRLLNPLCQVLRKDIIHVNDLLLKYIFKFIAEIPLEEQKYIITYLSGLVARNGGQISILISSLAEIPFISIDNRLYKVKQLYDSEIIFIRTFLPHLSLPETWEKSHFGELFTKLGLNKQVSLECIFQIAKSLSQPQQKNLPILLKELSRALNRIHWSEIDSDTYSILERIREVKFLPSWKRDRITEDHVTDVTEIVGRFCDAQQYEYQDCCCTTAYIHTFSFDFPPESLQYLNIIIDPKPEIVMGHLKAISDQIENQSLIDNPNWAEEYFKSPIDIPNGYQKYFKSSYIYLEKCKDNNLDDFRRLRCILWGNKLYYPINMLFTSNQELSPHIIQIPPKLAAEYPSFMARIGVMERADYTHFAFVLFKIHSCSKGNLVSSGLFDQAVVVFNNLIKDLRKLNTPNPPPDLDLAFTFLLTMNSELHPSTKVIYVDNPSLLSRANKLKINLNILNTLEADEKKSCVPPSCLRLKKLSEILKEKLNPSFEIRQPTDLNRLLKELICSSNFHRLLRRLYYHLTKKDLEHLFLKNGEIYLKDENNSLNPPAGYYSVCKILQNLEVISIKRIDLLLVHSTYGKTFSLPDACSCYMDKDCLYLSDLRSMSHYILGEIAFLINGYLGNIFKEISSSFELCFKAAPSELMEIMNKLDEYNIIRDPWPLPAELDPNITVARGHSGHSFSGSFGAPTRPRPESISLGEPDIPAAKLAIKISQCDLLAAEKLISKCEHNNYVFPAHACFLCFESLLKTFRSLLHLMGSSDRLTRVRDMRKHLKFVKIVLSKITLPHVYQDIENLTLPLLNYDIDTGDASTVFLPTIGIGCLIPHQIFSLSQANQAIQNAKEVMLLLMQNFPVLNAALLSEDDLILSGSEPAILMAIRNGK